jgi:flagellar biosynthesis protein FliP
MMDRTMVHDNVTKDWLDRPIARRIATASVLAAGMMLAVEAASAQMGGASVVAMPKISVGMSPAQNPKDVAVTLQVLLTLTVLTLAPSILIMTTAFTRIAIVLSIMRSGLGLPSVPPNQVLIGLALIMTFFVMRPTFEEINDKALQPYFANKMTFQAALDRGVKPLRSFMIRQTYTKDMQFFVSIAKLKTPPQTSDDVPISVVIPAFVTSELKTAFIIGFYIYLPFLIIDIVVASTLMSMGMMMLPPTMISLPAKLLLFVMANGWTLLLGSLAQGFR